MMNVDKMSLNEIHKLEESISLRKEAILSDYDCKFSDSTFGYYANLEFRDQPDFVILMIDAGTGRVPLQQSVSLPHQIYHKKLEKIKATYPSLVRIEAIGVVTSQLQTIWETPRGCATRP